jgi:tRNA-modifying protein YgfZ
MASEPRPITPLGDPAREAAAALAGAVLADRSCLGRIRMLGKDRQDLLHRLSTHDIKSLSPGEGCLTALLNEKGRILDLLQALAGGDDLLLITSAGAAERIRAWLDSYIFVEEVMLEDPGGFCLGLYGPGSPALLRRVAGGDWEDLPLCHHRPARIAGAAARVARSFPLAGRGYLVIGTEGSPASVGEALLAAGAVAAGAEALERLRVAAGVPGIGRELSEEFNPWESGLDAAVSLTKGCYLGQEVVARLHHYGKVRRRLSGILLLEPEPPEPGAQVFSDGVRIGSITSAAISPDSAAAMALAHVAIEAATPGREVAVEWGGRRRAGRIVSLPFLPGPA